MAKLTFAGIQIENEPTQLYQNVFRACELIRELEPVDLVVLPELFTSGYSTEAFQELKSLAEDPTGPSFQAFSRVARQKNCYVSFGFPRKGKKGYYISQAVINRQGEVEGIYDKVHLAQFGNAVEKDYFLPGDKRFTFEINEIKIGLAICYDFRFPEYIRKLAVEDKIDFLIHPSVFKEDHTFYSWHSFVATRSIENQIYVLSLNRAGPEYGYSIFWRPNDTRPSGILMPDKSVLYGEIDTELLEKVRKIYPLLEDRKLEF